MAAWRWFWFLIALASADACVAASAFTVRHQDASFDVYRLDQGEEQRLRFFWKRPDGTDYGSLHALREALEAEGRELVFAVNGGIYSEQFTPLGLYIENGERYYQLNRGRRRRQLLPPAERRVLRHGDRRARRANR